MTASDGDAELRGIGNVYRRMASAEPRVWWGPVLRGAIALVLGVIVFTLNAGGKDAVRLACIWIGVFALANGAIALATVFLDHTGAPRTLPATVAVISLILGVLLVVFPVTMAAIAIVLLGLFLIAMGVMQIYSGAKLRDLDPQHAFNGLLVFGIVLIVLGLLTVLLPLFVARVFIFIAALILILVGVCLIAIGLSIRSALKV